MKAWMVIILIIIAIIPMTLKADIVKKILFSNKGYAKQIEVKTYILTQEQVSDLFKNPDKAPVQLTVEELNKATNETKKRYFVIRVKNLGNLHAWGELSCKVRCIYDPFKIPIIIIRDQFCDSVICITGVAIAKAKNSVYPDISYEWSNLCTK